MRSTGSTGLENILKVVIEIRINRLTTSVGWVDAGFHEHLHAAPGWRLLRGTFKLASKGHQELADTRFLHRKTGANYPPGRGLSAKTCSRAIWAHHFVIAH